MSTIEQRKLYLGNTDKPDPTVSALFDKRDQSRASIHREQIATNQYDLAEERRLARIKRKSRKSHIRPSSPIKEVQTPTIVEPIEDRIARIGALNDLSYALAMLKAGRKSGELSRREFTDLHQIIAGDYRQKQREHMEHMSKKGGN